MHMSDGIMVFYPNNMHPHTTAANVGWWQACWADTARRCGQVTTTDQATAEVGTEPLKALGDFRSGRVLGWNARSGYKRELMFGWNLVRACGLPVCTYPD